jgi:hypothetical protein
VTFRAPSASAGVFLDLHFEMEDTGDLFFENFGLGLFVDLEAGVRMFLRNLGLCPNCTALQHRKRHLLLEESILGSLTEKILKRILRKDASRTYGMTTLSKFVYQVSAFFSVNLLRKFKISVLISIFVHLYFSN